MNHVKNVAQQHVFIVAVKTTGQGRLNGNNMTELAKINLKLLSLLIIDSARRFLNDRSNRT